MSCFASFFTRTAPVTTCVSSSEIRSASATRASLDSICCSSTATTRTRGAGTISRIGGRYSCLAVTSSFTTRTMVTKCSEPLSTSFRRIRAKPFRRLSSTPFTGTTPAGRWRTSANSRTSCAGPPVRNEMIVFFVRKANDVDHLTPVVYRLSQEAHDPVLVLCLSPRYDVKSDYRLNFLSTLPRVRVTYQFAYHAPTLGHRLLAKLLCHASTFRRARRPRRIDRVGAAFTRAVYLVTMA